MACEEQPHWLGNALRRVQMMGSPVQVSWTLRSLLARPHLMLDPTMVGSLVANELVSKQLGVFIVDSWAHDDDNVTLNRTLSALLTGPHWCEPMCTDDSAMERASRFCRPILEALMQTVPTPTARRSTTSTDRKSSRQRSAEQTIARFIYVLGLPLCGTCGEHLCWTFFTSNFWELNARAASHTCRFANEGAPVSHSHENRHDNDNDGAANARLQVVPEPGDMEVNREEAHDQMVVDDDEARVEDQDSFDDEELALQEMLEEDLCGQTYFFNHQHDSHGDQNADENEAEALATAAAVAAVATAATVTVPNWNHANVVDVHDHVHQMNMARLHLVEALPNYRGIGEQLRVTWNSQEYLEVSDVHMLPLASVFCVCVRTCISDAPQAAGLFRIVTRRFTWANCARFLRLCEYSIASVIIHEIVTQSDQDEVSRLCYGLLANARSTSVAAMCEVLRVVLCAFISNIEGPSQKCSALNAVSDSVLYTWKRDVDAMYMGRPPHSAVTAFSQCIALLRIEACRPINAYLAF